MSVKKSRGETLVLFSNFYEKDGNEFDGGADLHFLYYGVLCFLFCSLI